MNDGTATPAALRVIQVALLSGVVLFGIVAWYLTRAGPYSDVPAETARYMSFVLVGLAAASLAALAVVRSLHESASDYGRKSTLTVVGWALGEAPGLLGGVLYLLTGNAVPYLTGLAVLLIAFLIVPIPEAP